jgi:hypothetical protein
MRKFLFFCVIIISLLNNEVYDLSNMPKKNILLFV